MEPRRRKVLLLVLCSVVVVMVVAALGVGRIVLHSKNAPAAAAPVSSSAKPSARPALGPAQAGSGSAAPTSAPTSAPTGAPARETTKRGAAMNPFGASKAALADSGVSWYYNWGADTQGISAPSGVQFTPMIWGAANANTATLTKAKTLGNTLLGFNEPDMAAQSNLSPAQALALWPQLEATGLRLGSPAPAYGADTPGSWFDQFMQGAQSKGYRVDFIALHWYGADFITASAVSQLKQYIEATYARWHKPIWLTEYALIKFGATTTYPSPAEQAAFVTASAKMLNGLSYLERYSWFIFSPPSDGNIGGTALYTAAGTPTGMGTAYRAAG